MMAEPVTCPVCRARVEVGPQCRRCKADLGLLFALEARRDAVLAAARQALSTGRAQEAIALAEGAEQLRRGSDARRLIAAAHLWLRDFRAAWHFYQV
ncbi:MAG: hypothetical protein ACHQ5A_13925 [Opitutales bacterium]